MTVHIVPIEPIEHRYSAQWLRWFKRDWPDHWHWVKGEDMIAQGEIKQGEFLDVVGTSFYKASQIAHIAELIHDGQLGNGDTLFFLDLWFPLTQVFYMLDALELDVKVSGILHAGTYDDNDFLSRKGMTSWAADIEKAWWQRCDDVVVFSHYHKRLLQQRRGLRRIHVMPFPYDASDLDQYRSEEKDLKCVFPHRMAPEKSPWLVNELRQCGIDVTTTVGLAKDEYFKTLGRAQYVVSWNEQETFGIAMAEAAYLGAHCLMPRRLSYPELWDGMCIVDSVGEMVSVLSEGKRERYKGPMPGPFTGERESIKAMRHLISDVIS